MTMRFFGGTSPNCRHGKSWNRDVFWQCNCLRTLCTLPPTHTWSIKISWYTNSYYSHYCLQIMSRNLSEHTQHSLRTHSTLPGHAWSALCKPFTLLPINLFRHNQSSFSSSSTQSRNLYCCQYILAKPFNFYSFRMFHTGFQLLHWRRFLFLTGFHLFQVIHFFWVFPRTFSSCCP